MVGYISIKQKNTKRTRELIIQYQNAFKFIYDIFIDEENNDNKKRYLIHEKRMRYMHDDDEVSKKIKKEEDS